MTMQAVSLVIAFKQLVSQDVQFMLPLQHAFQEFCLSCISTFHPSHQYHRKHYTPHQNQEYKHSQDDKIHIHDTPISFDVAKLLLFHKTSCPNSCIHVPICAKSMSHFMQMHEMGHFFNTKSTIF